MKSLYTKEVLGHPLVLGAIGVVLIIAMGGSAYYIIGSRPPTVAWQAASRGAIAEVVTASGIVEPAENPDLAFASSGRVASVSVVVGQPVAAGETLATLDLGTLEASREQAVANVAAAQAKLAGLEAPTRATDLGVKQTAVAQAQQSLANTYTNAQVAIGTAHDQVVSAVHTNTDALFSQPNAAQPTILFQTTNSQAAIDTDTARASLIIRITQWESEISALSPASSATDTEQALADSLSTLTLVRGYTTHLLAALASATPSGAFSPSAITAAQTAALALNTTTNAQIAALQGQQQQIAAAKLAIQSAQDALTQTTAGATTQDIQAAEASVQAAQATIDSIDAQIRNAVVVAPFSGTVASVAVKPGQTIAAGTTAVSLTPASALQMTLYLSEIDAARVHTGDPAAVTLDALGNSRVFPATVVSVDQSPSSDPAHTATGPAYKATLQFTTADPAIALGQTANATITTAQKTGALIIPKSAVITDGAQSFVLVAQGGTPTRQPVTLGIESTSTVEVESGLTDGQSFLITAH